MKTFQLLLIQKLTIDQFSCIHESSSPSFVGV